MRVNTDHNSLNGDDSDLDAVITEVRQEIKTTFFKRKDLIIKLGKAFERTVSNSESICEEIKNALREEIVKGAISRRDIERYCLSNGRKRLGLKREERQIVVLSTRARSYPTHNRHLWKFSN